MSNGVSEVTQDSVLALKYGYVITKQRNLADLAFVFVCGVPTQTNVLTDNEFITYISTGKGTLFS